jgi:hypothetical protein
MTDKSTRGGLVAVGIAVSMGFFVYLSVSLVGAYLFGNSLQTNVLSNISGVPSWISIVLCILIITVITCQIPYAFFVSKESALIIIMEARS